MPASRKQFQVSDQDRATFARQARALAGEENDDEGSAAWRERNRDVENRRRAAAGLAPLQEWWEEKTEMELHVRARALGLLGRVR